MLVLNMWMRKICLSCKSEQRTIHYYHDKGGGFRRFEVHRGVEIRITSEREKVITCIVTQDEYANDKKYC